MYDAVALFNAGIELANGAKSFRLSGKNDEQRKKEICKWLRQIYFMPDGVISILEDLLEGREIGEDRRERVLSNFNDAEWRVQAISNELRFEQLAKDLSLSLRTARALDLIRFGKLRVRAQVQEAINSFGQPDIQIDREKIERLLDAIRQLNETILEVESALH